MKKKIDENYQFKALQEAARAKEACDQIHDYFKMKYEDETLSEYTMTLISGMFFYIKELEINDVNDDEVDFLKNMFDCYGLALPANIDSFATLLSEMIAHQWVKIQDSTGKYLYGPYEEMKDCCPSFKITRCQRSFNRAIEKLKHALDSNVVNKEIAEAGDWINDAFKGMDYYTALCLIAWIEQKKGSQTKEQRQMCLPNDTIVENTEKWWELIFAYTHIGTTDDCLVPGQDKTVYCEALFVVVEALKEMGAFVTLCSFFIISSFNSVDYGLPLLDLAYYLIRRFQNSYIYQIELPATNANLKIPVDQRKAEEHTTRMKIYLLDKGSIPTVLRVDFPHAGEECLHLNIRNINGADKDDHLPIKVLNGKYENLLDSVSEGMFRECPQIFNVKDSTSSDDEKVLSDMQMFKLYFCMCIDYLEGKEGSAHLKPFKQMMQKEFSDIQEAIFEGRVYFKSKIGI